VSDVFGIEKRAATEWSKRASRSLTTKSTDPLASDRLPRENADVRTQRGDKGPFHPTSIVADVLRKHILFYDIADEVPATSEKDREDREIEQTF